MPKPSKTVGFRAGPAGACEASLYEFVSCAAPETAAARRLIAATTLLEAVAYLAATEPGFRTRTVNNLGLVVLLSGSPTV